MSVNGFMKILVRALEVRDHRDPLERRAVYDMSRQTLERFFLQSTDLDEASRADQRQELEAAIAEIERRIDEDTEARAEDEAEPATADDDVAPSASLPSQPPVSAPAPPEPRRPAPSADVEEAAITPASESDDEVATETPSEATLQPSRHDDHIDRPHRPPAIELFDVLPDDGSPTPFEAAIEAEAEEAKRRNRRGMFVLLGLLLLIVVAYEIGLDEAVRRLLVGRTLPGSTIETAPSVAVGPVGPALAAEIGRLARAPEADVTAARLVIDGGGGATVDVVGRIDWTRSVHGDRPSLRGHLVFPERATVVDLLFEEEVSPVDRFDRMILAAFTDLPEPFADIAMFDRVDPKGLAERAAEGTVVRIGLDRALYGYRSVDADRAAAFEERSLFRLRFAFESGRRGHLLIRLPDPN